MPAWAPIAALTVSLILAWLNFLFTGKWAALHGALHGWKAPWYAAALGAATVLAVTTWRRIGDRATLPPALLRAMLSAGAAVIVTGLLLRLPLSSWGLVAFWDDWVPIYQEALNGVRMLRQGVVVGWNWAFLGGYPTSTELSQSIAVLAYLPMQLFGDRVGFHLLHAIFFLAVPLFVWWDLRQDDRRLALLAGAFGAFFATGFYGTLAFSGDTNSLAGVFCVGLALVGSRAARLGRRWGGAVLVLALTFGLYSHVAFFLYTLMFLALEVLYFRDWNAALRLLIATAIAGVASLPLHWEAISYSAYLRVNNTVYDPTQGVDWMGVVRAVYYNVEMLAFPHRWFNDYRSLANVWWPAMLVVAIGPRSRAGFYAAAALLSQALLRLNTADLGVIFDRITHVFPLLTAPALAGFVLSWSGSRRLAIAIAAVLALYVQSDFTPVPHVASVRDFDPPLIDRITSSDGSVVLIEVSPHHNMEADTSRRSPKTPFNVHFEGLLPEQTGKRFYGQMWDGWAWNIFRGQMVAAGTFGGRSINDTEPSAFEQEMRRWGVGHLFVWTDATRSYLAKSGRFVERWRHDRWSDFELLTSDTRDVVVSRGSGHLERLGFTGGDVVLDGVAAGDTIVVRTNYHPAWSAQRDGQTVALFSQDAQLAFRAPANGSYTVRLQYPARRWLSVIAMLTFIAGIAWLISPRRSGPH